MARPGHGCRPGRSCRQGLVDAKREFAGRRDLAWESHSSPATAWPFQYFSIALRGLPSTTKQRHVNHKAMIQYLEDMLELAMAGNPQGVFFFISLYSFVLLAYSFVYQLRVQDGLAQSATLMTPELISGALEKDNHQSRCFNPKQAIDTSLVAKNLLVLEFHLGCF